MKTLILLIALTLTSALPAHARQADPPEGTRITSAQVSGLDLGKLSPELQEQISKLAGSPLDRQQLRELAARIESEQPRFVAALRVTPDPDGGARVVFVAARMRDPEHQANVNAKYVVEDVKVRGVAESALTPQLRADMQALTGKPLDPGLAEQLETRLKSEFPKYDVSRRTVRGSQHGQITLIFELKRAEWSRWLRFEPNQSNATYHSDQGWGAFADIPIGGRDVRVTPLFAMDTTDDLLEEYSGVGVRFEARKLGTERLGVTLEGSWFEQNWREPTLAAVAFNPRIPAPYEERTTFTPLVTFAVTPHLRLSGGVSIAELEPLESIVASPASFMANTAIGSIGYSLRHRQTSGPRHDLEAAFTVRSGTQSLESDLLYTRSLGQADYSFRMGRQHVLVSGMGGVINGDAPLFERFALGDVRTLRGWDKYDISPAGGDQMIYASVEYRYGALALFLDSGSVWDKGTERRFRVSTGGGLQAGPFFMTVGVPLNTDNLRAVFVTGLRFSRSGIKKY